jgi:ribosomal protein L29
MKFVDLLKKDRKELCGLCTELKKEYMNFRILTVTTHDVKSSVVRECRKSIARVKTRLRQLRH